MNLKQIGIIHSPYKERSDAPRQGRLRNDKFKIEIFPEYEKGLKDIEKATNLIVLFWCDKADRNTLSVTTPWDVNPHGVFVTRSPQRPNPIAFDIVNLIKKEGNILHVEKMDALDKTPLIDIKPYSPSIDSIPEAKTAWFEKAMQKDS